METPTTEPTSIIAGDSVTWKKTLADFPASAGWVLSYALRGPAAIDIIAAAEGDDHLVSKAPDVTTLWAAGFYAWTAIVTLAGQRYTVDQGNVEILADPVTATGVVDQRPHCKRVLDAIEAVLEGKASRDQQEYEIDGVRISRMDIDKLLRWRSTYRVEWQAWQRKQQVAKGKSNGNRVLVRFPE